MKQVNIEAVESALNATLFCDCFHVRQYKSIIFVTKDLFFDIDIDDMMAISICLTNSHRKGSVSVFRDDDGDLLYALQLIFSVESLLDRFIYPEEEK